MSKELAKIKVDVPIIVGLDDLEFKKSDSLELNNLLDDLEFRTIKNRMILQGLLIDKKE